MCRILAIESKENVSPNPFLHAFAAMAKASKEYQGHGWGCAWMGENGWRMHRSIRPVWDDDFPEISITQRLLVHARSAFRDEGIVIENNMPFQHGDHVFIFNGELHGVRIREEGRIGAEKIFRFMLRFHRGDLEAAARRAVPIIEKRSRYIRAMNWALAGPRETVYGSLFNEDPAYFRLHEMKTGTMNLIASQPVHVTGLFEAGRWRPITNRTFGRIEP